MTRLLRVELTRAVWRRACLVLLLLCLAGPLLIATATILSHDVPSAETARQIEAEAEAGLRAAEREVDRCLRRPDQYGVDPEGDVQAQCEDFLVPMEEDLYYQYSYEILDLDRERVEGSGIAVAAVVGVLMFLLGTTFAGHDWATGSMANQLLFQPQRIKVWLAKAVAVTTIALVAAFVTVTTFWFVLDWAVSSGGFEPRAGALLDGLQQGWRASGLAAAAALAGYSLTMLSRSTVFSLGLLFGVSVAGGVLIGVIGPDDPGPIDPTINAAAIVQDGTEYYVEPPAECYDEGSPYVPGECSGERTRSLSGGVTYYGVLILAVGAASGFSFRRRDVP